MKILQDEVFEVVCEFYDDLKSICDSLNLSSAQEVREYLKNTPKGNESREILLSKLHSVSFVEQFSSRLLERGRQAMRVGAGDDVAVVHDMLQSMFYKKIEKIKDYLYKNGVDFDALPYDEKYKEFKKTLVLEDERVKDGFSKIFERTYQVIEDDKAQIEDNSNNSVD